MKPKLWRWYRFDYGELTHVSNNLLGDESLRHSVTAIQQRVMCDLPELIVLFWEDRDIMQIYVPEEQ